MSPIDSNEDVDPKEDEPMMFGDHTIQISRTTLRDMMGLPPADLAAIFFLTVILAAYGAEITPRAWLESVAQEFTPDDDQWTGFYRDYIAMEINFTL